MPSDERINIEIKAEVSLPPAEELRMAAATLRELEAETNRVHVPRFGAGTQVPQPWHDWWAITSPDMALPLANMLEAFTGPAENAGWIDGMTGFADLQAAVDLARKINRHRDEAS